MSVFTRTFTIACEDLGGNTPPTLLMTFDDQPMQGIYKDYYPVGWKRSTFPIKGSHAMTATYQNQLVFVNPQVENDKIIDAATWVDINLGQQTDLTEESGSEVTTFTPPYGGAGAKYIKANNKTHSPQTIGVGFDNGGTPPPTLLLFNDVGYNYNVTAEFTPTLRAYITADYQENSVIRGAIQTPAIWTVNLASLPETSSWKLTYDYASGDYSIDRA